MVAFGKSSGGGRRSDPREAAPLLAVFTTRLAKFNGILVDISATGARIRAECLPAIEEEGALALDEVRTFGTVRWKSAIEFGMQFEEPLLQAEVIGLRREVASGGMLPPELKAARNDWVLGLAR